KHRPRRFHPRATHHLTRLETVRTVPRSGIRMTYRFAFARLTQSVELAGSPAIRLREVGSCRNRQTGVGPDVRFESGDVISSGPVSDTRRRGMPFAEPPHPRAQGTTV